MGNDGVLVPVYTPIFLLINETLTFVNGNASQQRAWFAKPSLDNSQNLMMQCSSESKVINF